MPRSNLIILATFALVLSAGVVVGRLWTQLLPAVKDDSERQQSWLAEQLKLSPQQQAQMDGIWADTKAKLDKAGERRTQLERDREQAVLGMLSPDQQKAYQKIVADFRSQRTELEKQRHDLIHDADQRSEALLDPDQKTRWEELRNHHGPGPGGPGPGGMGHGGPGAGGPGHGRPGGPDHDEMGGPPPPPGDMGGGGPPTTGPM